MGTLFHHMSQCSKNFCCMCTCWYMSCVNIYLVTVLESCVMASVVMLSMRSFVLFLFFFFRKSFTMYHFFFPRGEVGKLKFLSNSQIGPYSLMPIATSPISDAASLTQPSPQQPVVF